MTTKTLNQHQRDLMDRARRLATRAQRAEVPGLIRGDLLKIPYEELLDTLILVARVCPVEYMHIAELPELVPCGHCGEPMVVTQRGAKYCCRECKQLAYNVRQSARRRAA